jgi:hypothetical protein
MGEKEQATQERRRKSGFKLKLGPNGKRLLSGAIAGAFSRTAVAPLETIRTHLMVGTMAIRSLKYFTGSSPTKDGLGFSVVTPSMSFASPPAKPSRLVLLLLSLSHYFYSLVKSFKQVFTHEQSKQANSRLQTAFLHVFHNFFSWVSFRSGRVFLPL